jgi:N-acetylglucosamine malate deacetylase 1
MTRDYLRRGYRTLLTAFYTRANFRLFLRASVLEVAENVRQLTAWTDYFSGSVRPIQISAPFGDSMLVLAPHQDDEAIGCGGAMALQARSGRPVHVVLLQDGGDEHREAGMSREALTAFRNEESRKAAAVLGLEEPRFLNARYLPDHVETAAAEIRRIIQERHVDAVFVPWLLDGHPDHRTANRTLVAALEGIRWKVRVFSYEVWGLVIPNVIVAIDEVIGKKLEMLACFAYANSAVDYVNGTKGLNMYRSRLLGSGPNKYAECFFEAPASEYIVMVNRVLGANRPAAAP